MAARWGALLLVLAIVGSSCTDGSGPTPDAASPALDPVATLEGTWATDTVTAAEIRAVVLDAGFTQEDADTVVEGTRTFRFELRFEGDGYELESTWDGEPVGVLEAGGYRLTGDDRLLLDTGDLGDTFLFAVDLQGDLLSLELIRTTESGTEVDQYVHSYFTTAFFTGHPFVRSE